MTPTMIFYDFIKSSRSKIEIGIAIGVGTVWSMEFGDRGEKSFVHSRVGDVVKSQKISLSLEGRGSG
jgi:hypothetical protein